MAAADARTYPAPGRVLSVDGRAMHILCTGTGSPTVVMDAGLGGWSMDWSEVQPAVARSTRVCTYDRPGMGWSSFIQVARPFGVGRLLSDSRLAGSVYPHFSPELQPAYRAGVNRASYVSTIAAESARRQAAP
jgi:pimeloyl-ACP methyl ester carboxylesterase